LQACLQKTRIKALRGQRPQGLILLEPHPMPERSEGNPVLPTIIKSLWQLPEAFLLASA